MEIGQRFFDIVEVCEEAASAHYKAAIGIRNRNMIDRGETVIFYINKEIGGAYDAFKYAKKIGKECVLLKCNK